MCLHSVEVGGCFYRVWMGTSIGWLGCVSVRALFFLLVLLSWMFLSLVPLPSIFSGRIHPRLDHGTAPCHVLFPLFHPSFFHLAFPSGRASVAPPRCPPPPWLRPFEKGPFPLSPSLAVGRDVWFGWLETRKDRSPDAPETRRAHVKGRGPGRSMSSLARLFTGKKEREGKEGKGKCV